VNDPIDPRRRSIDIDIEYLLNRFQSRGHMMRLRPDAARWMGSPSASHMRVSDAERNAVADNLSRHFSEGRLDETEFKERLDAARSAKTQGDLDGLFDDLPSFAPEPPSPPSRRRRLVPSLFLLALVVLVAGSAVSVWDAVRVPWFLIVVVAFFLWRRAGRHHVHHHG
jgi:hypothetical protein